MAKKLLLLSSLFFLFIQTATSQGTDSWVSVFSENDQHENQELSNEISSLDTEIYIATQTFEYDSIDKLFNLNLIQPTFNTVLTKKKEKNSRLIEVYSKYVEIGKQNIDSVPDYKISLEYSYDQSKKNKNDLNTLTVDNISQLAEAKSLLGICKTQEKVIFNQKQFFTFFSIAGKSHLLSNNNSISNLSTKQTFNTKSDDIQYANVIINDEVVESIQISISKYQPENNSIYDITNFDIDNLNKIWTGYIYEEEAELEPEPFTEKIDTTYADTSFTTSTNDLIVTKEKIEPAKINEEIADIAILSETITSEQPDTKTEPQQPITKDESSIQEPVLNTNKTTNVVQKEENATIKKPNTNSPIKETSSFSSGLVYRVQIAADNVPLSERKLNRRYKGVREIKMFQEEGWYKYYIAETKTLKEAIIIKKESNVADAFVMAYNNGTKVKYYLKYQKAEKGSVPPKNFIDLKSLSENRIIVVVQVAADTEPLSEERLSNLYQGGKPLNYIFEEGWHKYSFGNYDKFWPANLARRKCGVKDAFVVAYKNGVKYDLWKKQKKDN